MPMFRFKVVVSCLVSADSVADLRDVYIDDAENADFSRIGILSVDVKDALDEHGNELDLDEEY